MLYVTYIKIKKSHIAFIALYYLISAVVYAVVIKDSATFCVNPDEVAHFKEAYASRVLGCSCQNDAYIQDHILKMKEVCKEIYIDYLYHKRINVIIFDKYKDTLGPAEFSSVIHYILVTFNAICITNPNPTNDFFLYLLYVKLFKTYNVNYAFLHNNLQQYFNSEDIGFKFIAKLYEQKEYLI